MEENKSLFKTYSGIIWLLCGIAAGSILGLVFGKDVAIIKPLGDIFLNLLFTAIIPLIFFTIASSIASLEKSEKLGKLFIVMIVVFLGTVLIAAILMIVGVYIFPIHQDIIISKMPLENIVTGDGGSQITQLLTANDFYELLAKKYASLNNIFIFNRFRQFKIR